MSDFFHNPIADRARRNENRWVHAQESEAAKQNLPARSSEGEGAHGVKLVNKVESCESGLSRFVRELLQGFGG